MQAQNQHLDHLIDLTFQGVNRFFAIPFPSDMAKSGHTTIFYLTVERKFQHYDPWNKLFWLNGKKFIWKHMIKFGKNSIGQGDDY